eukprot:4747291-Pleurochrysis_carterae.AAC.1
MGEPHLVVDVNYLRRRYAKHTAKPRERHCHNLMAGVIIAAVAAVAAAATLTSFTNISLAMHCHQFLILLWSRVRLEPIFCLGSIGLHAAGLRPLAHPRLPPPIRSL